MRVVIDSNRVFAALIADSTTREILFDDFFEFYAPEFIIEEIEKYKSLLLEKSGLSSDEFDILLSIVFRKIRVVSKEDYGGLIENFSEEIPDFKDIPYLAVCYLKKAEGIWTHDMHFRDQDKFRIYTNADMLGFDK